MAFETLESMDVNQALGAVEAIRGQVMVMGANDSEQAQFDEIVGRIERGEYKNPQDAVFEAQKILDGKQAYH